MGHDSVPGKRCVRYGKGQTKEHILSTLLGKKIVNAEITSANLDPALYRRFATF